MLSRWLTSPLLIVLLLVGACSATPTGPSPFIGDPTGLEPLPGRLLVLGEDGAIFVVRPDGSDRRDLAAGSEDIVRTQPTWSPDGTRAAWTESARGLTFLVTATADGAEQTRSEIPFPALYLAWDPTGSRLALSGNADDGSLKLTVSVPGGVLEVVDEGAPMWIDWNSSGSELLVHVADRFEAISMEGGSRRPIAVDGDFRVGIHVGDGLVFTTGNDVGEMLVFGDQDGSVRTELLRVGNPTAFVADSSGRRLAVMSIPSASTQALAEAESGSVLVLPPNRLMVIDLESVQFWEVARARAVAWFFSPAGDHPLRHPGRSRRSDAIAVAYLGWAGVDQLSDLSAHRRLRPRLPRLLRPIRSEPLVLGSRRVRLRVRGRHRPHQPRHLGAASLRGPSGPGGIGGSGDVVEKVASRQYVPFLVLLPTFRSCCLRRTWS